MGLDFPRAMEDPDATLQRELERCAVERKCAELIGGLVETFFLSRVSRDEDALAKFKRGVALLRNTRDVAMAALEE